jgi:hypothetical protein
MKSVRAYSLDAKMMEVRDPMKYDHVPSRRSWLKLNLARVKVELRVETLEHEFPFY